MSATVRCKRCKNKLAVRFDTVDGALVEIVEPCGWCARKDAGLCQRCHVRPVFATKGLGLWCSECYPAVRREQQKRIRRRNQDSWKHAGICMDCHERPVDGKVGWAETCEPCRAERKRRSAKRSYQKDPEKRRRRNEYKREWRKRNKARVKMAKRREALRRGGETPAWIKRWRERVASGEHVPKRARRNENGDRLCLRDPCPNVVGGRAKLCNDCRAGLPIRTEGERRAA